MASGITNTGKSNLLTSLGWGQTIDVELLTDVYSPSQIKTLTRSELATATGGNYEPNSIYVAFLSILDSDLPNFYKLETIFPLEWYNLSTDNTATIKGFALCRASDVYLVQELPEYTPDGSDYSITFVDNTIAKFSLVSGQYFSDVVFKSILSSGYDLLSQDIYAELVTATTNKYSRYATNFTFATGGNYSGQILTGKNIYTNGGRVILDANDPVWTNLNTNGLPVTGVAFVVDSDKVLCYHELSTSFTPSGNTITYNLSNNGVLYLGDV